MLTRMMSITALFLFVITGCSIAADAQDAGKAAVSAPVKAAAAEDKEAAYTKTLEKRAADILALLALKDEAKEKTLRDAIISQYRYINTWHEANNAKVKELSKKNDDAAKAEIEKLKAPLREQHGKFIALLEANLTAEQIEKVKNYIVKDKLPVTYRVYCEMLPQLTEEQKAKIYEILKQGREEAMMAGSSEEKTLIFGKYKGKVNIYLSGLGINMKEAEKQWQARTKAARAEKDGNQPPAAPQAKETK